MLHQVLWPAIGTILLAGVVWLLAVGIHTDFVKDGQK